MISDQTVEIETRQHTWCFCSCCLNTSFCLRSSNTFRWEFECWVSTNVGLAAGRYSGTSRPDLYRTPHALHRVFGPKGPVRHCGVFSEAQCVHRRTPPSGDDCRWERSLFPFASGDNVQLVALDRLLRALPGNNDVSDPTTELDGKSENESSTNLDNHSSSATSSVYKTSKKTKLFSQNTKEKTKWEGKKQRSSDRDAEVVSGVSWERRESDERGSRVLRWKGIRGGSGDGFERGIGAGCGRDGEKIVIGEIKKIINAE